MSFSLTENLPVLTNALQYKDALPAALQRDLNLACFAIVSILFDVDLKANPDEAIRVVKQLDFSKAKLPTITDHTSLEIVLSSLTKLRVNQGTFLPASEIIAELVNCSIVQRKLDKIEILGESYGVLEYYGSQFPLLNRSLIIDTPLGRIKNVLEINSRFNKAIVEIIESSPNIKGKDRLCVIVGGRPVLSVGTVIPNEFKYITFNSAGITEGIYQLGGEAYLFQSNKTLDLDLEGDFVKAEFVKNTSRPTGIIATSKFIYLVNHGELHDKISIQHYSDFQLNVALVESEKSRQVVFWGVVKAKEWEIPFLNYDLSRPNLKDLPREPLEEGIPKEESVVMTLSSEPVFYRGQLYFQAEIADRGTAFCIVSLDSNGTPSVNSIFSVNSCAVESFEPMDDFSRLGNALVRAAGETFCLLNGNFYHQSKDLQFLNDLPCQVLGDSKEVFSKLLFTETGWKIIIDSENSFNLNSVIFPSATESPIGIHVNSNNELTCLTQPTLGDALVLYCSNHPIGLLEVDDFQSLLGVHYYDNKHICCLFKAKDAYVSLTFEEIGDDLFPRSSLTLTDAQITPMGLIGNLESKDPIMIINDQTLSGYQYQSYNTVRLISGGRLHCIQTDRGVVIMTDDQQENEIYHDYQITRDLQANLIIAKSDPTVQISFRFNQIQN